ncbi:FAD-binding oxidoreductase [Paenibacillus sp. sptzw28]|uniref:FAD-binding oxidoreductase n=1 Tax=Paenibacillus sp. sptzw28 TaxID=715179 RepID=UPI001C6F2346|nr:FAD-binding oxidoreductase [Paenibacillus sp. sptzw28]QYR19661.1 FAD-binding oxidoreductase [Paenibacillus sp. sptzw28]
MIRAFRTSAASSRRLWAAALAVYAALFAASLLIRSNMPSAEYASDVSRLMSVRVYKVVHVKDTEDIAEALREAGRKGLPISVSGARHSQGGQTFYDNAIVLDMRDYNEVIRVDGTSKRIQVQSGATWEQVQEAVQQLGLSVRIMQSQNLFTVGGSMSVNVHGRDMGEGPLIESVESFRLMLADGRIVRVSRTENAELFPLVIGGYGLFGIILDADLRLTDDTVYKQKTVPIGYRNFPDYFRGHVNDNPDVAMAIARLSVSPNHYLTDMFVTTYDKSDEPLSGSLKKLNDERFIGATKFMFGLSRKFDWGKDLIWNLQKKGYMMKDGQLISRNNAMRPAAQFMEYADPQKTDLLQEYFVPVDRFIPFVDGLRDILRKDGLNLLNITVRYVPRNEEAVLSYSRHDSFAFVLLFNNKRSPEAVKRLEQSTQSITDLALRNNGTYYLPYQLFASPGQLRQAYPRADEFFAAKRRLDPELRFINEFYARYAP